MAMAKKQQIAKLYNVRSVVDGMITAVDAGALSLDQALSTITAVLSKASEENFNAKEEPVQL